MDGAGLVVAMVFDFIYEDKQLSDRLKSTISRLQIPYIKIAILDRSFFSQKSHPARELLNIFSHADLAVDPDIIADKVTSLVDRVANEFCDDLSLFQQLLDEFQTFLSEQQASHQDNSQQMIAEAEQCEVRAQAVKQVDAVLTERMKNLSIPPLIGDFIQEIWHPLLVNCYLTYGEKSRDWMLLLGITEDLIWSTEPKISISERQHLTRLIPRLLGHLRENLENCSWEKDRIEQLFDELELCHISALKGKCYVAERAEEELPAEPRQALSQRLMQALQNVSHEEVILDASGIRSQDINPDDSSSPISGSVSDDGLESFDDQVEELVTEPSGDYYFDKVSELQEGDWVEFTEDEKQKPIRARVFWCSESEQRIKFCNWQNEVVKECSFRGFADLLRNWDARVMDKLPVMDRALNSVMNLLDKHQQPTH